jgi:carbamate kinase
MGPKVESALRFLRHGGREVVITSYELMCAAVAGKAGTHIVPDAALEAEKEKLAVATGGRL